MKFLMRFAMFIAFFCFIGLFFYAYLLDEQYTPPGRIAPFSENGEVKDVYNIYPQNQSEGKIDTPNVSVRELQNLLTAMVSESLTMDSQNRAETFVAIDKYFTESGLNDYKDYLQRTDILNQIESSNKLLAVVVEEPPILLNKLNIENVYRWLFDIPVSITLSSRPTNSYSRSTAPPVTSQLSIRVQLRRVDLPNNSEAIQIESWKVNARR